VAEVAALAEADEEPPDGQYSTQCGDEPEREGDFGIAVWDLPRATDRNLIGVTGLG
jgi:hypothetical protein